MDLTTCKVFFFLGCLAGISLVSRYHYTSMNQRIFNGNSQISRRYMSKIHSGLFFIVDSRLMYKTILYNPADKFTKTVESMADD